MKKLIKTLMIIAVWSFAGVVMPVIARADDNEIRVIRQHEKPGPGTVEENQTADVTTVIVPEEGPAMQNAADPGRPMIALTFDDGPSGITTPRVLAALEKHRAKATFFMVGSRVEQNADVVRRMAADGNEVGNHTWGHEYINKLSAEQIMTTVGNTNTVITNVCGITPTVMRPPGGNRSDASLAVIGQMGMSAYLWSVDPRDWKTRNTQTTVEHVLNNIKDGDIVLMHDIYEATAAAAEILIPELTARGYQLVTLSELAAARGGVQAGGCYSSFRP